MSESMQFAFGPYRLDPATRTLARDGQLVRLMPKDVAVLTALVERRGQVVTRERLLAQVWPGVIVEDCNLARHVATLRQALGDSPEAPAFIETLPKVGYRFIAPVATTTVDPGAPGSTTMPEGDPAPAAAPPGRSEPAPSGLDAPPRPSSGSGCSMAAMIGADAALASEGRAGPGRWQALMHRTPRAVLGLGAVALLSLFGWRASDEHAQAYGPIRSLALLPIENLTGDPRQDHVAAQLGEMMVNDLGRVRELQLVSRNESRRFGGSTLSARAIGRELGVEGLLEAAIVRADDRIRVTAELVDTRTDKLIWSEVFEGDSSDLVELQDLIASAAVEALGLGAASPAAAAGVVSGSRGGSAAAPDQGAPQPAR